MKHYYNTSYWDHQSWFTTNDFIVIGSGIVGLNTALELQEKHPTANITILERGVWPQGASTKNAGFACLGSVSELLKDFENHSAEEVFLLVEQRLLGLERLRTIVGDDLLDYKQLGGYEVFLDTHETLYSSCIENVEELNSLLFPFFNNPIFEIVSNSFGFKKIFPNLIYNAFEGQIDTGKMMMALLYKVQKAGIKILNNCNVLSYEQENSFVSVKTTLGNFKTTHLLIATNGFSEQLQIPNVKPARAQVLITKPIKNLKIKGTFHIEEGFYYFRNIGDRILFGGGRNLDFKTEETAEFGETEIIQNALDQYLKTHILPDTAFEIDQRWSGILGIGDQKKPIIKKISENVFCGVRLGGMGIAIGSLVGRDLANLVLK